MDAKIQAGLRVTASVLDHSVRLGFSEINPARGKNVGAGRHFNVCLVIIFIIYIRKEGRRIKTLRKKHDRLVISYMPPTRDQAHKLLVPGSRLNS